MDASHEGLGRPGPDGSSPPPEISIVMPCLNESDTLATCIRRAQDTLREHGIPGEVIVADNGSTDGSPEIAMELGARVVHVPMRGYGSALMGGIGAARSRYVLMGDADSSYDFGELPRFLACLREGYQLVQGCRLPSGGGAIEPGAMPLLHRWWGNPMFSALARLWFRSPINDVHCGLRAFERGFYEELDLRCTGMEFATEMVIKASLSGARIAEVPITLHRDGRVSHPPHLRTFRDGWRHLRFYLMSSPRWLFLAPGGLLVVLGLIATGVALPGLRVGGVRFDVNTLLFGGLGVICGYQSIVFAVLTKAFAISEGLLPWDPRMGRFLQRAPLERGLLLGAVGGLVGMSLLAIAINQWRLVGFGDLDYSRTMRWVIPGMTLTVLGFQTVLSSFFLGILGMSRR